MNRPNEYKVSPTKQVYIPKANGGERPLGIPTIADRCLQSLVKLILEPVTETTSDHFSFGFRKNRSAKNALAEIRYSLKGDYENKFALDADIKGFFDNISHDWIMSNVPLNPVCKIFLNKWLKAGFIYADKYETTSQGTPHGGIISPVIANFVLDGLETTVYKAIEYFTKSKAREKTVRYKDNEGTTQIRNLSARIKVVRYADDFVIFGRSRRMLQIVRNDVNDFLKTRGVWLSEEKTKIINLKTEPLHFLGYVFKYRDYWKPNYGFVKEHIGGKAIAMYPDIKKVRSIIARLRKIYRENTNNNSYNLIAKLNPIIRGWSNYFNLGNSSRYRDYVRQALYRFSWKWAFKKHPRWGKKRIAKFYFKGDDGQQFKKRTWVFRGSNSRYKKNMNGKKIFLVDPTNIVTTMTAMEYLIPKSLKPIHAFHSEKEKVVQINLKASLKSQGYYGSMKEKLMKKQNGICSVCNNKLIRQDQETLLIQDLEIHHIQPIRKKGERHKIQNMTIIHKWCHKKVHSVESHSNKGSYK